MDFWNKPIPTSCLHNFPSRFEDLKCNFLEDIDSYSISSIEYDNSDADSYFDTNPISSRTIQHLTHVVVEPQIVFTPFAHTTQHRGELVDSGGNFSMTNRLDILLNVVAIKPFSIGMAAQESKSSSFCTHRGEFPIQMCDGSTFYTPMFYNAQASETILSPESICYHSNGALTHWTQSGSTLADGGSISFFDSNGAETIALSLVKRNGLYYTPVSAIGVNSVDPTLKPSANYSIHFHHSDPAICDDISIETTDSASTESQPTPHVVYECQTTPQPRQRKGPSMPPRTPPISIPTPKSHRSTCRVDDFIPKEKQIEADLWQARLGHCSEWQLKVLPMSADGLPSRFHPHPFASYDHYNHARIRKRPATRGKHPSRAVKKRQRWFMDFGFLRASTTDYSRPDKTRDRVVTSFDGYNAYLIIVDEYTKFVWVYLCVSKDPPIDLIELHLDQFGTKGIHIRCDQGGELAGCSEFITRMAARGHVVEPTGADSPNQNKQAEKWNDIFGVTVRVLLYGSGFPAMFWSAALLHAVFLHNRRVSKSTMMTPFEAWHGFKPDLRLLRVFGSRVCVKKTGKRRSKLDKHAFTGIFLGYTATDENIRYIEVDTRIVKTSHHAIFDEAWYLQPRRPPFAQMLFDIGLEPYDSRP
jgi:hypothetical protein